LSSRNRRRRYFGDSGFALINLGRQKKVSLMDEMTSGKEKFIKPKPR